MSKQNIKPGKFIPTSRPNEQQCTSTSPQSRLGLRAAFATIAWVVVSLSIGCQFNGKLDFSRSPNLPTPPDSIDLASFDAEVPDEDGPRSPADNGANAGSNRRTSVRYQSPDNNRIRSLNDFSYEAAVKAQSQQLATQQQRQTERVAAVIINGNQQLDPRNLKRNMRTRPGRFFDPDKLQQDVNELWRTPGISRIKGPFLNKTKEGVIVTLEVVEAASINEVKYIGNRGISDNKLKNETGLESGKPLDVHEIQLAKSKIEEFYHSKGFPRTQVEILEGSEDADSSVVFLIHEDEKQRIWKVDFEGNTIASDGRLKSFIQSKPGVLKLIGGLVKRNEIEQDITRLTSYYRTLGFFNARIGREISESNDGRWLSLRFIINEGPRYRVRRVSFIGNRAYAADQLASLIELKPSEVAAPEFNVSKMNADVVALRELYGGQGFIFADVVAEPRFLEEPGLLDIVYKIEEGKQFYAGNIRVHYEGGGGITRREVILNRMSVRTGDLINVQEIRNSERRLGASNVFAGAQGGSPPRIVVAEPGSTEAERLAKAGISGGGGRSSGSGSRPAPRSAARPSGGSGSR